MDAAVVGFDGANDGNAEDDDSDEDRDDGGANAADKAFDNLRRPDWHASPATNSTTPLAQAHEATETATSGAVLCATNANASAPIASRRRSPTIADASSVSSVVASNAIAVRSASQRLPVCSATTVSTSVGK